MQLLLEKIDSKSAFACAVKILVLASIGNRLRRKSLIIKTEKQYGNLLRTLHQSLCAETKWVSIEEFVHGYSIGPLRIEKYSSNFSPLTNIQLA
jgi:hypothetical protein